MGIIMLQISDKKIVKLLLKWSYLLYVLCVPYCQLYLTAILSVASYLWQGKSESDIKSAVVFCQTYF